MKFIFLLVFGAVFLLTICSRSSAHSESSEHKTSSRKIVNVKLQYTDSHGNKVTPSKIKKPIAYFPYSLIDVYLDNVLNLTSIYFYEIKFYNLTNHLVDMEACYHESRRFSLVPRSMMPKYQNYNGTNLFYFYEFVYYTSNMQVVTNFSQSQCHEKIYIHKNLRNFSRPLNEVSEVVYFRYILTDRDGFRIENSQSYLRRLKTSPPFTPNIILWSRYQDHSYHESSSVINSNNTLNTSHHHQYHPNETLVDHQIKVFYYLSNMTRAYSSYIMNSTDFIEYAPKTYPGPYTYIYYTTIFKDFNGLLITNLTNFVRSCEFHPNFLPLYAFNASLPQNTIYFDTLFYFNNGTLIPTLNASIIDPVISIIYRPIEALTNPSLSMLRIYYEYGTVLPNGTIISLGADVEVESPLFITPQITRWISFFLHEKKMDLFVSYFYPNRSQIDSIESYVKNLTRLAMYMPYTESIPAINLTNPYAVVKSEVWLYETKFYNYYGAEIGSRKNYYLTENLVLSPWSTAGLFSPDESINVIFYKNLFYFKNGTLISNTTTELLRMNHSIIYKPKVNTSELEIIYYRYFQPNGTSLPNGIQYEPLPLMPQIFWLFRYHINGYIKYSPKFYYSSNLSLISDFKQFIVTNGGKLITYAPKSTYGIALSSLLTSREVFYYSIIFYNSDGNSIVNLAEYVEQLNGSISLAPSSKFYDLSLRQNYTNIIYYETVFFKRTTSGYLKMMDFRIYQNRSTEIIYVPIHLADRPNYFNETMMVYYGYEFVFENGTLVTNPAMYTHLIREPLYFFPQFSYYLMLSQRTQRHWRVSYYPIYYYSNLTQIWKLQHAMQHFQSQIVYQPHPGCLGSNTPILYYYEIVFYNQNRSVIASLENYTRNLVGSIYLRPLYSSMHHHQNYQHGNLIYYSIKFHHLNGSLISNIYEAFQNKACRIIYAPYSLYLNSSQGYTIVYYSYQFKYFNGSIITNSSSWFEKIKKPLALLPYVRYSMSRTVTIAISYRVHFYCSKGKRITSLREKIYSAKKAIIYVPKTAIRLRRPEDLPHSIVYYYDLLFYNPNGTQINLTCYLASRTGKILLQPISKLNLSNHSPSVQNVIYYRFVFYYSNGNLIVDYSSAFRGKSHLIIYRPRLYQKTRSEFEIIYYDFFFKNRHTGKALLRYHEYLKKIEKPLVFLPQTSLYYDAYSQYSYQTNYYYVNLTRIGQIEQYVRKTSKEIVYVPKVFYNNANYQKLSKIFYYETVFTTMKGSRIQCLSKHLEHVKGSIVIMSKSRCRHFENPTNANVICYELIFYHTSGRRVDDSKAFHGSRGLVVYRPKSAIKLKKDDPRRMNYVTVFYEYTFKDACGMVSVDASLAQMINFPLAMIPQLNCECAETEIETSGKKCCGNNKISLQIDTSVKINFDLNNHGLGKVVPNLNDMIRNSPYFNKNLLNGMKKNCDDEAEDDSQESEEDCDCDDENESDDEDESEESSDEDSHENEDKSHEKSDKHTNHNRKHVEHKKRERKFDVVEENSTNYFQDLWHEEDLMDFE